MRTLKSLLLLGAVLAAASCVTINVYFPAAAAESAAEKFVDDVLGEAREESLLFDPTAAPPSAMLAVVGRVLDTLVPSAHAQQPDFTINTPQINAIKSRMAQRQRQHLNDWFDAGAIGFTNDGLISIRDRSAVSLDQRRNLESVVADENRDRRAVYREIAVANGQPEWQDEIQQTWAREWQRNARPGWYYQAPDGSWKQK
ncbi:MAG: YdbL family protein [Xanthomonadales bacterium]